MNHLVLSLRMFLLPLVFLVTPVMMFCAPFQNSRDNAMVSKQRGSSNIIFDYTGAIDPTDWPFVDYIQVYKNGTPQGKVNKNKKYKLGLRYAKLRNV